MLPCARDLSSRDIIRGSHGDVLTVTSVEQARGLRRNSPHGDSKDLRSNYAWESAGINTSRLQSP